MREPNRTPALIGVLALLVLATVSDVRPAEGEVELTGYLRAREAERFSVPLTNTWQIQLKWLIEEGMPVEAGEPIARFDTSGLEDQLAETEESLVETTRQRNLDGSEGRLQRMGLELEQVRADIELRKAEIDAGVPRSTMDGIEYKRLQRVREQARKRYENAQLGLEAHDRAQAAKMTETELKLAQTKDKIERYKKELESLTLRATRQGIVVHEVHPWFGRKVRAGDQLQATFPVASIPDLSTLEVEAWAGEIDLARIGKGRAVRLRLDAYPTRWFEGRVVDVARGGEERELWGSTPYFKVRIDLPDTDQDLMKPGMSVRCELAASSPMDVAQVEGASGDLP